MNFCDGILGHRPTYEPRIQLQGFWRQPPAPWGGSSLLPIPIQYFCILTVTIINYKQDTYQVHCHKTRCHSLPTYITSQFLLVARMQPEEHPQEKISSQGVDPITTSICGTKRSSSSIFKINKYLIAPASCFKETSVCRTLYSPGKLIVS